MEKTGFHEDFINGAGKTVTAEIFFYMESEPSDKQILYLSKGSEEILIFHLEKVYRRGLQKARRTRTQVTVFEDGVMIHSGFFYGRNCR